MPVGVKLVSRLHCLLESVEGLCKKRTLSLRVSAFNDKAKGICQLGRYGTQVLVPTRKR